MITHADFQKLYKTINHQKVQLVAVSKLKTIDEIRELYSYGQCDFGENYVQELLPKYESLPKDIRWHFIGHLQKNKVKHIAPFIHLIQSVDSIELLEIIAKQAVLNNRKIPCLLQVHLGHETTKHGFLENQISELIKNLTKQSLQGVDIQGFMGIASNTQNPEQIRAEYRSLKKLFDEYRPVFEQNGHIFNTLSMGMSNDYKLAIIEGATMIRLGTILFGSR